MPSSWCRSLVQVRERAAGQHGLRDHPAESHHGETAVGQLLHLKLLHRLRILSELQRIKTCEASSQTPSLTTLGHRPYGSLGLIGLMAVTPKSPALRPDPRSVWSMAMVPTISSRPAIEITDARASVKHQRFTLAQYANSAAYLMVPIKSLCYMHRKASGSPIQISRFPIEPVLTAASCASSVEKSKPGRWRKSVNAKPTVANMLTRQCFSSASRSQSCTAPLVS